MTESKTPLPVAKENDASANTSSDKNATKKSTVKAKTVNKSSPSTPANKVSKLAIFAILIAIAAPAGHYYWQQQQNLLLTQFLTEKINSDNEAKLSRYNNQMQKALTGQQQSVNQQLQQIIEQIQTTSQEKLSSLETTVKLLEQGIKQRQPSDWLLHEAEYLIRIAARTVWLEQDTKAAIGLLEDADNRLAELNDPSYLPVRESIHQDIKSLSLMPTLETDKVVLTLMALSKQIDELPLAIEALGQTNAEETDLNLTDDIQDWQSNLAKSWQKFINDFIKVRHRTGSIEPLMSPEQQDNLKQNLSLKIQLAIWAASERKGTLYKKALEDIQQWLNDFFDMENNLNQQFFSTLVELQNKQIDFNYSNDLSSLSAIRAALKSQRNTPIQSLTTDESDTTMEPKETVEISTEKTDQLPEAEKDKNEGSI